jgi:hypothetical protein
LERVQTKGSSSSHLAVSLVEPPVDCNKLAKSEVAAMHSRLACILGAPERHLSAIISTAL